MQFDLSCLTRWRHPCSNVDDIMPTAWGEYLSQQQKAGAAGEELRECGPLVMRLLGRDSLNAAIVETRNDLKAVAEMQIGEFQNVKVRLVKRLKGAEFWDEGTERKFTLDRWSVSPSLPLRIPSRSQFIFLFHHWPTASDQPAWVEQCGAIPFSEANLALVREGIEQDYQATSSPR